MIALGQSSRKRAISSTLVFGCAGTTAAAKNAAAAANTWSDRTDFIDAAGAKGGSYSCAFISRYFRTVQFEQDSVQGTTPFDRYDTGLLPSGGLTRSLTVAGSASSANNGDRSAFAAPVNSSA